MWNLMFITYVAVGLEWDEIPVYYSTETSSSLITQFSNFSPKILILTPKNFTLIKSQTSPGSLFIDITLTPSFLPNFDEISAFSEASYFTITYKNSLLSPKRRIYPLSSIEDEVQALEKLLNWFELKAFILLSSSLTQNLEFSDLIKEKMGAKVIKYASYNEDLSLDYGKNFIQKEIKSLGVNFFVIIDRGPSLKTIQESLISKKINETGTLFIFPSYAIGSVFIEGSLILSQEGLEESKSYDEYCYFSIINYLKSKNTEKYSWNLEETKNSFSILNYQNGVQVKIGSMTPNISISSSIIFPGGEFSLNSKKTKELVLLFANGTNDVANSFSYSLFSYFYNGAIFAVNEVNSNNLIPHFKLTLRPTETGIFAFNEDWYKYKLSQYLTRPFPILYLTSYWFASAVGNSIALKSLNYSIPQISPFAQKAIAENKQNFPNLVKLSVSEEEFLSNGLNFLFSFNWKSIVLFGTDDVTFYSLFLAVEKLAKARGVKIVNPEHLRVFPANYSKNDFEKFKHFFKAAKETRCRIFLIFAWDRGPIWEGLYDVGLRKGDFYTLGDTATLDHLNRGKDDEELMKKKKELVLGSFILSYKEWNGEKGEQLYLKLSQIFPDVSYFCMCYDTVTVATNAISYALQYGKDYENAEEMMKIIRDGKVQGCMGSVYFSRDNNNVANAKFQISQIREDASGNAYSAPLALLDKLSVTYLLYIDEIQWSSVPENFIPVSICPFEIREIKNSSKGLQMMIGICSVLFLMSLISAIFSWKHFQGSFFSLSESRVMSLSDKAFFLYPFMQFFQFMVMGPDQDAYRKIVRNLDSLISLDFEKFYDLSNEKFWIAFLSALVLAVVLNLISILIIFNCQVRYSQSWFFENLMSFQELLLPLIANVMFLPILSMILNVFLCSDSIGDALSDLYMDKDCSYFCYTGDHKKISVVSFVIVFLFVAINVYLRPYWEIAQSCLSIRTKSSYFSVLSLLQVALVSMNKTLKLKNQLAHGIFSSGLLFLFILFTIKIRPYNYDQANIVQLISLSAAFWGIFTATIFSEIGDFFVWSVTQFVGFAVVAVVGIVFLTRTKNLLKNPKGRDISSLFIFQFCKNYEKYARDMETLHFVRYGSQYIVPDSTKNAVKSEAYDFKFR